MKLRLCAAAAAISVTAQAVRLQKDSDESILAQAEASAGAMTEAETEFISKLIDALFGGKGEKKPYDQRAPNVNVVDNARVMIPEGADPTAVKLIIGDIMDNGIGGVKGAMNILKDLGGPGGWGTWNLPASYQ